MALHSKIGAQGIHGLLPQCARVLREKLWAPYNGEALEIGLRQMESADLNREAGRATKNNVTVESVTAKATLCLERW